MSGIERRHPVFLLTLIGLVLAASSPVVRGQPVPGKMPNLREISGRPLPDRSMAIGTVTVRVANKTLASPVAQTEIVAIIVIPGGDSRKRTARTDDEGRATFEGLAPGSRFHAEVQIAGETVKSDDFTIPDGGGIRTMLIGGLGHENPGASPGGGEDEANLPTEPPRFTLGIISGTAAIDAQLPAGTIVVQALDAKGNPLGGQSVELGVVSAGGQVEVTQKITSGAGTATFSDVGTRTAVAPAGAPAASPPTAGVAAAVVMSLRGVRFGTDGFAMPKTGGGIRVELRVPEKTADPSVVTIGPGGRIILQLRDDALGFIETMPLVNASGKIFDPGVGGIEIPLPSEATNAEGAEGEHKIEIRKGIGVAIHGPIPPHRPAVSDPSQKSPDEVTFGFIMPLRGSSLKFEQRFPNGLGEFTFVTEQLAGLTIESAQLDGRQERELNGKKYWLMRGHSVPAGDSLQFKVMGLPAADNAGKVVSAILSIGLLLMAIVLSRNPDSAGSGARAKERQELIERRERLFGELLSVEARRSRQVATAGVGSPAPAAVATSPQRDELVRKLENVYRELATLDERRVG